MKSPRLYWLRPETSHSEFSHEKDVGPWQRSFDLLRPILSYGISRQVSKTLGGEEGIDS